MWKFPGSAEACLPLLESKLNLPGANLIFMIISQVVPRLQNPVALENCAHAFAGGKLGAYGVFALHLLLSGL